MNSVSKFNKNQSGQAALEAAIILIAFVVVASVFAFAVLSAGTASTERGEQAIYNGLEQVQSSMSIKGAVIAEGAGAAVTHVVFTVSPVSGGDPVNLDDVAATKVVTIAYRDSTQSAANLPFTVTELVGDGDDMLEDSELFEIDVNMATGATGLTTALGVNTAFTLEVKPPTGAVIGINRTTPAAISAVMELR
jgi:archaeal flagellin FlaB